MARCSTGISIHRIQSILSNSLMKVKSGQWISILLDICWLQARATTLHVGGAEDGLAQTLRMTAFISDERRRKSWVTEKKRKKTMISQALCLVFTAVRLSITIRRKASIMVPVPASTADQRPVASLSQVLILLLVLRCQLEYQVSLLCSKYKRRLLAKAKAKGIPIDPRTVRHAAAVAGINKEVAVAEAEAEEGLADRMRTDVAEVEVTTVPSGTIHINARTVFPSYRVGHA